MVTMATLLGIWIRCSIGDYSLADVEKGLMLQLNKVFKDNRAIFQIPSKSKSIKSYEN